MRAPMPVPQHRPIDQNLLHWDRKSSILYTTLGQFICAAGIRNKEPKRTGLRLSKGEGCQILMHRVQFFFPCSSGKRVTMTWRVMMVICESYSGEKETVPRPLYWKRLSPVWECDSGFNQKIERELWQDGPWVLIFVMHKHF